MREQQLLTAGLACERCQVQIPSISSSSFSGGKVMGKILLLLGSIINPQVDAGAFPWKLLRAKRVAKGPWLNLRAHARHAENHSYNPKHLQLKVLTWTVL